MTEKTLDVVGIGNAIVDVMTYVEDGFIEKFGLNKGTMALVDEARVEQLYRAMGACAESSGGSVANTLAGVASFGGSAGFIGKVRDDAFGRVFSHDLRGAGVEFGTPPATDGLGTARSLIVVTPDAQRTMNTFLGVAAEIYSYDIDRDLIARAKVLMLEGYLWDSLEARAGLTKAMKIAKESRTKVAFSLSDPFCVDRHRKDFLALVEGQIDLVFANEAEIMSLYEVQDFRSAVEKVRGRCEIAAITRSEKGSVVITGDNEYAVPAEKIPEIIDSTGAGDLYASGFLYGLTHGLEPAACAALGSRAAGSIIQHLGARPLKPLKNLL